MKENSWHKSLYGEFSASVGLDSAERHRMARAEARFLQKELNLLKGSRALDLPCGTGRHALALGKLGIEVVGVDLNNVCVAKAKANCLKYKNVQIRKGDMSRLKWAAGRFDAVLNLFSSFGYFESDQKNQQILEGFGAALKPGGSVVIQVINRDFLLKIFDPARWGENSKFYWQEGSRYDSKTKYIESHRSFIDKKSGRGEVSYNKMRLYSVPEMKRLLRSVGFQKLRVFDGISGKPVQRTESSHPIYIGQNLS